MGCGAVLHMTGESKFTELGGLWKKMPWTFVFTLIGGLSISAFPLFSGFVSKSMIVSAGFEEHKLLGRLPAPARLRGNVPSHRAEGALLHLVRKEPAQAGNLGPRRRAAVEHERRHDRRFRALHLHRLLHALPLQDAAVSRGGQPNTILTPPTTSSRRCRFCSSPGWASSCCSRSWCPSPRSAWTWTGSTAKAGAPSSGSPSNPIQSVDTFIGELYRYAGPDPAHAHGQSVGRCSITTSLTVRWMASPRASGASAGGSASFNGARCSRTWRSPLPSLPRSSSLFSGISYALAR